MLDSLLAFEAGLLCWFVCAAVSIISNVSKCCLSSLPNSFTIFWCISVGSHGGNEHPVMLPWEAPNLKGRARPSDSERISRRRAQTGGNTVRSGQYYVR